MLLWLFVMPFALANAEDPARPVTGSYRLEIGGMNARSTYLSPLKYSGTSVGASGEWRKSFQKNPENLVMTFSGAVNFEDMINTPGSARMLGADAEFNWGMAYRTRLPKDFQITAGGVVDINGGALYLTRNGNNPVSVNAWAGIDLTASASWHFTLGKLPILVSENVKLPTLGAFFCPGYGETYYEIYLGNHKGLAHCGWWGNHFSISNFLCLTLDFGRTAMELGYRYDYRSSSANNLVTRTSRNSFVIGVIPGGIGLKKKNNINSALY